MPESTAQSSSMPEPPPHVPDRTVPSSSSNADAEELQQGSCPTADPKNGQHASGRPWPPRYASSAAPEPTTSGATSQYPDTHNRSIIAASATLAYLQSKCRKENSPNDCSDQSTSTKVRALTSLCRGLLRKPGETIAISADVFQNEILLAVAHDDSSRIPLETGTSEGERPEKVFYMCPELYTHILLQAIPELCSDWPSHRWTTHAQEHLIRLHSIIADNWKMTPDEDTEAMPKWTGHSEKLQSTIDFYREHSAQIQKEHPRILFALHTIEYALYTVHPLRFCLWSQVGGTFLAPELNKLEDQHEKWFSDCAIDATPAQVSLDELSQICDRVSDLWLATGGTPTRVDADPHDALEAAQETLEQGQTTENITSYFYTMALMIHSSRKALEHLVHMFSLWVEIGETHNGHVLDELDTRVEITWCSMALYSAQITWNELMKCPWTVACALHLLAEDPDTPAPPTNGGQGRVPEDRMDVEDVEGEDEGDIYQALNSDPARPPRFSSVFVAVDNTQVRDMLEGCFRLDAVMRRQNEAHGVIEAFTVGKADSESDEKPVHISFISDKDNHQIDKTDVIEIIREYWKKEASANTDTRAQKGFDILSELADTSELSQHHLQMNLGRPRVHCECVLAQHWIARPRRANQAFPVIGVSSYACGTCKLFMEAVLEHVCEQAARCMKRMIPGARDAFCLCMVPEQSPPEVKKAVADALLHKLRTQLRDVKIATFLEGQLDAARVNAVDSNSCRRGFDGLNSLDGVTGSFSGTPEDEEQMTDI
ncbi:hypothetical protein INS49_011239 [Diaporthe citri]|uniref:uncharacterized protein n=1 Tax=Diaporthe citri TaxID=83186 RepID=UPI001C7F6BC4|nr:uncharacterized protein INS49_011239 [Diaporthe citri]KAG6360183.1 hypothetical protein INS49_011239 [Diaporthe citri]